MKKYMLSITLVILLTILVSGVASAQAYTFNIPEETVNVFWNEDGTTSLDYVIVFNNDPGAHAIDYVDLGLPNPSFVDSSITADVNGVQVTDISRSGFQGTGASGVALGLGSQTIAPGGKGTVHAHVGTVRKMLEPDTQSGDVSAVFAPAWFTTAHGDTNLTVIFHFPVGVGENDATYHDTEPGWADQPIGNVSAQGLVSFTWNNPKASMNHEIDFGASFPSKYVPAGSVSVPATASASNQSNTNPSNNQGGGLLTVLVIAIGLAAIGGIGYLLNSGGKEYVPPKVSVDGYGIKRGLTAVEAAVVLGEPFDKILSMILYSVVKKEGAEVVSTDPLNIKVNHPFPGSLTTYEYQFLEALDKYPIDRLQDALESPMSQLIIEVNSKMEGFNRQDTMNFYRKVVQDAWAQVEAAETPELTSWKFQENMDWAMLDDQYAPRTQRLFENKTVSMPLWWPHLFPNVHPSTAGAPPASQVSVPAFTDLGGTLGGKISMPVLPGADFAASIAGSTQNFSNKVIGDLNTFAQNVKQKAAPPPPPPRPAASPSLWGSSSSSSRSSGYTFQPHHTGGGSHHASGGGHHCACAGGGR